MPRQAVLLSVSLLLAGGPALAQPYFEAGVGYARAQFSLGAPYNGVVDDRSVMLGLNGGFRFGERWAVEAGFNRYGGFDGRATPCPGGAVCPQIVTGVDGNDVVIYKLAFVPSFDIESFRVFGRAGYYRASIDTEIGLPGNRFNENGVLLGAGVRWYFEEPWSVSLEATRFDDKIYQIGVAIGWGLHPFD